MPLKRKKVNKKKRESKSAFMDRCMHEITNNSDTKRNQDQRVAICLTYYNKQANEGEIEDKIDMMLHENCGGSHGKKKRKRQGNGKGMAESVTTAENGIMDTLEYGDMTKDEVFKMIKKEYGLKRHEFNQAWDTLIEEGDIVKVSGNKWRRN